MVNDPKVERQYEEHQAKMAEMIAADETADPGELEPLEEVAFAYGLSDVEEVQEEEGEDDQGESE